MILTSKCRWVNDKDVPGGRFLVPGCWHRAIHGDDADCQCDVRKVTLHEEVQLLRAELSALRAELLIPPPRQAPTQEAMDL